MIIRPGRANRYGYDRISGNGTWLEAELRRPIGIDRTVSCPITFNFYGDDRAVEFRFPLEDGRWAYGLLLPIVID